MREQVAFKPPAFKKQKTKQRVCIDPADADKLHTAEKTAQEEKKEKHATHVVTAPTPVVDNKRRTPQAKQERVQVQTSP